jgi:anti-sigma factor RsiW
VSCPDRRLAELVDGRLSAAAADQLFGHVADCPECRRELRELHRLRSLLAAAPGADERLVDRLTLLPITQPLPVYRPETLSPRRRRGRQAAALAGGATIVAAAVAWGATTTTAVPQPAQVVPQVERYSVEHAASTYRFPLSTPGSAVLQVSYGGTVAPTPPPTGRPARP